MGSLAPAEDGRFQRLMGLETEYLVRVRSLDGQSSPHNYDIFESFTEAVAKLTPTAQVYYGKAGCFLGNGGSLFFEAVRHQARSGLFEGGTPECRSPRQTVIWQRAQDRLLSEALGQVEDETLELALVKNNRDSFGHCYGAQENYEVVFANGCPLWAWRFCVVLLIPIVMMTWLAVAALLLVFCVYLLATFLICLPICLVWPRVGDALAYAMAGIDSSEEKGDGESLHWLQSLVYWCLVILDGPLLLATTLSCRAFGFLDFCRYANAFLASRNLIGGAGTLENDNRTFRLAEKVDSRTTYMAVLFGVFAAPVISCGHFANIAGWQWLFDPKAFAKLFNRKQRLQIALGDSNMAQRSEYLRIGTTWLVLEAIEAGQLTDAPRLASPRKAFKELNSDDLSAVTQLRDGRSVTALTLQRYYLDACQKFVDGLTEAPSETKQILSLWRETLDAIERNPDELFGKIDWATKRCLLKTIAPGERYEVRKKIDLKYHELTDDGYYRRLEQAGLTEQLVHPDEVRQAMALPPPDSPATMRSRFIREFSGGEQLIRVNWDAVFLGKGLRRKAIRLARFSRKR